MKPFLVTTRFLRPNPTSRVAHVPFVVLKGISFPARCNSTLENADPLPQSKSPDTADSSQHTSVANANAFGQKRARCRPWTPDEQRKLKAAIAKGLTIKAMATLFPTRSLSAVAGQRAALVDKNLYNKTRERRKWSPEEMNLLAKLHADGLTPFAMRAHFPAWSTECIRKKIVASLGAKSPAKAKGYTPEEIAVLFQMRHDNASFKQIAEKLGRSMNSVNGAYYKHRPFRDSDAKVSKKVHTRLPIEDLECISALRAQGVSWPEIGNRYPTHSFESIAENYKRFLGFNLSADHFREIVRLRNAGKTWDEIVKSDQFYHFTKASLQHRYYHALRKLKSQQ